MGRLRNSVSAGVRRARIALKAFAYSGFGRDRWQLPDRVVGELGLKPGDRVADLGAGGGYFTFRLARAVLPAGVVYAVDTDPDMRSAMAARAARDGSGNVVPVEAVPDDPALPDPVDLAFIVNAFHHLPDRRTYLAQLASFLRPGGRVAIVESRPAGFHRLIGHATAPEAIRAELEAAGYTLVADHGFLPRQCFLVFEWPPDGAVPPSPPAG
jgi:arsenite methyltransferase